MQNRCVARVQPFALANSRCAVPTHRSCLQPQGIHQPSASIQTSLRGSHHACNGSSHSRPGAGGALADRTAAAAGSGRGAAAAVGVGVGGFAASSDTSAKPGSSPVRCPGDHATKGSALVGVACWSARVGVVAAAAMPATAAGLACWSSTEPASATTSSAGLRGTWRVAPLSTLPPPAAAYDPAAPPAAISPVAPPANMLATSASLAASRLCRPPMEVLAH